MKKIVSIEATNGRSWIQDTKQSVYLVSVSHSIHSTALFHIGDGDACVDIALSERIEDDGHD